MYFCKILLDFGLRASILIISVCGGRLGRDPESGQLHVIDLGDGVGKGFLGWGGGGVMIQNQTTPDFRIIEVGISVKLSY